MVHTQADWKLNYPVLVPYSDSTSVVSAKNIAAAVKRGVLVLPVEGNPLSVSATIAAGANGVYTNDLTAALVTAGRIPTGPMAASLVPLPAALPPDSAVQN
jgi:hypothetical protein